MVSQPLSTKAWMGNSCCHTSASWPRQTGIASRLISRTSSAFRWRPIAVSTAEHQPQGFSKPHPASAGRPSRSASSRWQITGWWCATRSSTPATRVACWEHLLAVAPAVGQYRRMLARPCLWPPECREGLAATRWKSGVYENSGPPIWIPEW